MKFILFVVLFSSVTCDDLTGAVAIGNGLGCATSLVLTVKNIFVNLLKANFINTC